MKNRIFKNESVVEKNGKIPSQKKQKILIVHASEEMRELMSIFLKSVEHEIFVAGTSEEALQILRKNKPDLMITNVVLSELHGGELIIKVRMKWSPKKLKIMIVSSMSLGKAFMKRYQVICRIQPPLEMQRFIADVQQVLAGECPSTSFQN